MLDGLSAGTGRDGEHGIVAGMVSGRVPRESIFLSIVKLLRFLGILPGAIAAFGVRKYGQKCEAGLSARTRDRYGG